MKYFLILLLVVIASVQGDNVTDIICPVQGNPDPSTVTEEQCSSYAACEYTSGSCHMKSNEESGYVVASEPVVSTSGIQLGLKKANAENTLFGSDIEELSVDVIYHEDYHVQLKSDDNIYGAYPYYINIEDDDGNTHSVHLENSNALEYSTFLLDGSPAVTVRAIGGILDFHLFFGPTPDDVTVQYTEFIGRPYLPPYWALGFQLSRWGYNSLDEYQVIHDRMIASQIPWDVQYFDIDYMDERRDFTYDHVNFESFPTVVDQLHSENLKLILIKDPAIAIDFDTYPTVQRRKR
ncbi:hypothetical protein Anas_05294 [Armadillidium nasatum]|uniref:Glycoside hydrolase family 31 TIM barrel domain-containing protein n=1 Tax=Armadillidium nasatum TaxID=96803 RepID=A0A5N5SNS4_9CRUS|nr:hypothetical protein Anas_05294 [Armadillidium nasatum]